MQVGDIIGTGGFSQVREANMVGSHSRHAECWSSSVQGRQYAAKVLKPFTKTSQETFEAGAVDLVNEATLWSHLNHENIIQLHGTTQGCMSKACFRPIGYFVLERLDYTLEDLRCSVLPITGVFKFLLLLKFEDQQLKKKHLIHEDVASGLVRH
jgi:hypothetical protein